MKALHKFVVGTDLSEQANLALERTLRLAGEHDAEVLAATVVPASAGAGDLPDSGQLPEDIIRRVAQQARERLRAQIAAAVPTTTVREETIVSDTSPFHEIVRLAHDNDADLIAVGAHGRHFAYELVVGSTTERVVRHAGRPVLVVKQRARSEYRRVLVPLDFSDASLAALRAAKLLGENAEIVVLHAYELWFEEWLQGGNTFDSDFVTVHQQVTSQAREQLREAVANGGLDPQHVTRLVRNGDPASVIVRAAEKRGCDLIAMGTKGASRLDEILLGSVTGHVLREAHCDVLTVPA